MSAPLWDATFDGIVRAAVPGLSPEAPLDPDLPFAAHGLDSIGLVQLIADLEDAYAVSFPDEVLVTRSFATPATTWETVTETMTRVHPA